MKSWTPTLTSLMFALGMALPTFAEGEGAESSPVATEETGSAIPKAPKLGEAGPNKSSFWGGGLGLVFTSIPISQSEFTVFMSELHYSRYLGDPNASLRTAASVGLFGFALVLPVPKVSMEMYLGNPTQDIQGKVGIGGFYDVAVGGHAGVFAEMGIRIKNRVDVTFFAVPAGADSKRDYLEFMGMRNKTDDDDGDGVPDYQETPHVIMPYFGLFIAVNY